MAGKIFGFMFIVLGLLPFLGFIAQGMSHSIGFFVGDIIMKQVQEL